MQKAPSTRESRFRLQGNLGSNKRGLSPSTPENRSILAVHRKGLSSWETRGIGGRHRSDEISQIRIRLTRIREGQFLEKSGDADQAEKAKKGRVIFGLCRRS